MEVAASEVDHDEVLTKEALDFVASLHRTFDGRRRELLEQREERQQSFLTGELPDFLEETRSIRAGGWRVAAAPDDLRDRRVEITGPTDRKMVINALNSGARVFMADFEDANSPTWENMVAGQRNLTQAIERTLSFDTPEGKAYRLNEAVATLMVRPRGWHLDEKHVLVDGVACSASLFDFGMYFFHNARRSIERGSGPYFYLPKLENHQEARLWNDVFLEAQSVLGLSPGTIKVTVLVETILAAFEMEEILYELREHIVGMNAGRWDYIFSIIKKFRDRENMVLPDRSDVTMAVPFMRAYTELLVKTCHARGAFAIGGMAAFIPSRKDPDVNRVAIAKVKEDKVREANAGFDGTWVAHPDLVSTAQDVFDEVMGSSPNQLDRQRPEVQVSASELLDVAIGEGRITEKGLRNNVSVAILYLESWLGGVGAAALYNLMEDAATAEISRSQIWQWIHHEARLEGGRKVDRNLVEEILDQELANCREVLGEERFAAGHFEEAVSLVRQIALGSRFEDFLTLHAYALLP